MGRLADAIANDYTFVDETETVTFRAKRASGTTSYTITDADSSDLTERDSAVSNGLYNVGDRRWSLGADQITNAAHTPQPEDEITDAAGVTWYVIDQAQQGKLGISWVVMTRREQ